MPKFLLSSFINERQEKEDKGWFVMLYPHIGAFPVTLPSAEQHELMHANLRRFVTRFTEQHQEPAEGLCQMEALAHF